MRILYTAFDNPAVETILSGMHTESLSGLPALYHPFRILLERGHTIDLLLFSADEKKDLVESEHFKRENLFHVRLPSAKNRFSALINTLAFPHLVKSSARKLMKQRKYDFVYGMGEGSGLAVSVAHRMGIPCGYRQFGVYNDFEHRVDKRKTTLTKRIAALLHHTYAYIAMRSSYDFMLTTNDGSHQNVLFEKLRIKKRFKYFFWKSGIPIPDSRPLPERQNGKAYPESFDDMRIVNIARFSPEKRQPRSAEILGWLHKKGYPMHLHYVGDDSSAAVKNAVLEEARRQNVTDYVHFEGRQEQKKTWQYARNSFVCLLPNESGLVNVFYETLAQGGAVVAAKTATLDDYIQNGENGFQFKTEEEAADYIIKLLEDRKLYDKIRAGAYATAREKLLSVDRRFGMEADLVEDTANGNSLEKYKEII